MAKEPLTTFQLMGSMLDASDLHEVRKVLERGLHYETHGYTPDPEQARKEKEALERKKWREQTRKRFEERMIRTWCQEAYDALHAADDSRAALKGE